MAGTARSGSHAGHVASIFSEIFGSVDFALEFLVLFIFFVNFSGLRVSGKSQNTFDCGSEGEEAQAKHNEPEVFLLRLISMVVVENV